MGNDNIFEGTKYIDGGRLPYSRWTSSFQKLIFLKAQRGKNELCIHFLKVPFLLLGIEVSASSEEVIRTELEELKKRVAYLEHQLVLREPPKPLNFSVRNRQKLMNVLSIYF